MEHFLLGFVLVLILIAEFINGWTDAPNAIATVISTRALSVRQAITMATVLNITGAFYGRAVATTIGTDIVAPEAMNLVTLTAAMIAVIGWGIFAWSLGMPISKSHALVASLAGAGMAVGGPGALIAEGWIKVIIGLVFSTLLGLILGWLIATLIQVIFAHRSPTPTRRIFGHLQVLSASFMAISHGSNDGQKFIGVFSLALFLGGISPVFYIPFWVIVLCACMMGLGTSIGGTRIIKTMGYKMVPLETYQGFSAEASASSTILLASTFGVPLSTTHTIGTAIMGVGLARRHTAVRWNVILQIIQAWVVTFPVCGFVSFVIAKIFHTLAM